jgi:divalent metal cation (Fe/Co/Zn/Cd) transporter
MSADRFVGDHDMTSESSGNVSDAGIVAGQRSRMTLLPAPDPGTAHAADQGCCAACEEIDRDDAAWLRAARHARVLSWVSLLWMTGEGVLGLIASVQDQSIALLGWALGSVIEGLASVIVIWRFTGARTHSETSEVRAQRAVAVSFFLLAPYITIEAVRDLVAGHTANPGLLGIVVTAASLLLMPVLGIAKRRLATQLGSGATAGEAVQNLLCAAQAGAVLIGLATTGALGWFWLDPAVALLLALWAIREGRAAWRGQNCC